MSEHRPLREILASIETELKGVRKDMAGDEGLQAIPKRCATHDAFLRSQWFHVRALWGVLGAIGLAALVAALAYAAQCH